MQTKTKKPCAYPGCPNLTHDTYCEEHQQSILVKQTYLLLIKISKICLKFIHYKIVQHH